MSTILKFDTEKENNYIFEKKIILITQKRQNLYVTVTFPLKQRGKKTDSGPIWYPLNAFSSTTSL